MDRLVKAGLVADDWANTPTKGFVSKSVVSFIVRKGNPKNIQHLGRPAQAGRQGPHAEPVHVGRGEVEHPRRLRRQERRRGERAGGPRLPARAHHEARRRSRTSPAARRCRTSRSGTGDVLISYENEAITAQKKGQKVDYVIPDQTILIENPIAVSRSRSTPQQAKAFVDYALSAAGPAEVRRLGLPAGRPGGLRQEQGQVPDPEGPVHDRRPRRLVEGQRRVLRPGQGLGRRRSRRTRGSPLPSERARRVVAARRRSARGAAPAARARSALGIATLWLSVDRPASRWPPSSRARPTAASARSGTRSRAAGGRGAEADPDHVARRRGDQRGASARSSPGCSSATASAASAIVNALIDLPFALPTIVAGITLLALYGPTAPVGINVVGTRGRS